MLWKFCSTPINNASSNDHLEVFKYLYEQCHADDETKDNYGNTPINIYSKIIHREFFQYLLQTKTSDVSI